MKSNYYNSKEADKLSGNKIESPQSLQLSRAAEAGAKIHQELIPGANE